MSEHPAGVELAPAAQSDLRSAALYVAEANPEAARSLVQATLGLIGALRRNPLLGMLVAGRTDGLRAATVPGFRTYRLFYRYDDQRHRLQVARVLHGARDWEALL